MTGYRTLNHVPVIIGKSLSCEIIGMLMLYGIIYTDICE